MAPDPGDLDRTSAEWRAVLRAILVEGQRQGLFVLDAPHALAPLLHGLIVAYFTTDPDTVADGRILPAEDFAELVVRSVRWADECVARSRA